MIRLIFDFVILSRINPYLINEAQKESRENTTHSFYMWKWEAPFLHRQKRGWGPVCIFFVRSYCVRKASQTHLLASVFPCVKMGKLELARLSKVIWNTLSETGWDLGCFTAVLQCLHLDTPLLQQQNTKKLYGPKNNCVHTHLGQILDQDIYIYIYIYI